MKRLPPFLVLLLIPALAYSAPAPQRGIQVKMRSGEVLTLYERSYALVLGIGNYTAGWPKLPNLSKELDPVVEVLQEQGFQVVRKDDLEGADLEAAFRDFIHDHGYDRNNRLLFFFAGHGHTMRDGSKGYLVPSDAPDPREDERGFLRKALSMDQILAWSRDMSAIHALFLFDSCFSGTIFKARDLPEAPPDISLLTIKPVRQYLTAGDAGEPVPAKSTFTPVFVDGLKYGLADMDKDGYITGSELGLFLRKEVSKRERQTPQFGKIPDYELSRGDFVFVAQQGAEWDEPSPLADAEQLEVRANVSGARVYVGGRDVGPVPAVVTDLKEGEHTVRIVKEGYKPWTGTVSVTAGRKRIVRALLEEEKPRKARLYVRPVPAGATVRILNIGPRFEQGMELDAGRYHVEVTLNGYEEHKEWVELSAEEDRDLEVRLTPVAPPVVSTDKAGPTIVDLVAGVEFTFAYIPPGTFMMGSPSAEPGRLDDEKRRPVTLTRGFYMQTTEVTQGQWKAVMGSDPFDFSVYMQTTEVTQGQRKAMMGSNPSHFSNCGDHCPVEQVSWNECQEFIRRLNLLSGAQRYRLPTEAEWEYAARAGTTTPFAFGNCLSTDQGNYNGQYPLSGCPEGQYRWKTVPVAGFSPNAWGLYDMHGNVSEWCQDWYGSYPSGAATDPKGPSSGSYRVNRGGGMHSYAWYCRSASRGRDTPDYQNRGLGLRLTRAAP